MKASEVNAYIYYLAAKKSVDDRSLNRRVWERLAREVECRRSAASFRVLEVGCGIGTMLERLRDWGLLNRAVYTGIDIRGEFIREATRRLVQSGAESTPATRRQSGDLVWPHGSQTVRVRLEPVDLFDFACRERGQSTFDLLVAHAFLDLVDLAATLPLLFSLLAPGGLFYFTLNFDGGTTFRPIIEPEMDARIEALYHDTMDRRRRHGKPSGSSHTGRRLFARLPAAGAQILAAGSSDWVVFPAKGGYPGDEAFFLHFIMDTISRALEGHPELPPAPFQDWLATRRRQIEQGELVYIAHQLDFLGYI